MPKILLIVLGCLRSVYYYVDAGFLCDAIDGDDEKRSFGRKNCALL